MNNTSCTPGGVRFGFGLRAGFVSHTSALAAMLPSAAANAHELPGTHVSLLWPLGLALFGVLLAATVLVQALRLRKISRLGDTRISALHSDNANLHRQLHSRSRELSLREKKLGQVRSNLEQIRQERSDLLAVIDHRLRRPVEALASTAKLLAPSVSGESRQLVVMFQNQLQSLRQSLEEMHRLGSFETVELTLPPKAPPPKTAGGLSILLIENGRHDSLRPPLEIRGHDVQVENNGVDGASAALRGGFNLVLLDSSLALMDGVEVAKKIRRAHGRELLIFALIAGLRAGDRERYMAQGLSGVLARPVVDSQLEQLLNWAVRQTRRLAPSTKRVQHGSLLNSGTLTRQRDTLGHLPFAELLGERIADLPKKTAVLAGALTGRHWLEAQQLARAIAASAGEVGLDEVAACLRTLAEQLSNDGEREACRYQRTEILNLMRSSVQQLKSWCEQNVHTEWALK